MANHFCKIEIENSRLYFEVSTPVGAIIDTFSIERVSVNDGNTQIPDVEVLYSSYPNPFNATAIISFDLAQTGGVNLSVYNLLGQKVEALLDDRVEAGNYNITWDASTYSSGVYFYRLTTGDKTFTKRMTLLK
ncbi:MAG: T9SS type A sorting domain-containing protein, partial [candidate division Zixibacteria bacterium]|nr:T9SS type A sorting domain-containing protein [candidate division Zixibacteria bacterium]